MEFGPDPPASPSAKRAEGLRETRDLLERVWELERRLEKHTVILEALATLIADRGVSGIVLMQEVRRIEASRAATIMAPCAKCGRPLRRQQAACVYCGHSRDVQSPFDFI